MTLNRKIAIALSLLLPLVAAQAGNRTKVTSNEFNKTKAASEAKAAGKEAKNPDTTEQATNATESTSEASTDKPTTTETENTEKSTATATEGEPAKTTDATEDETAKNAEASEGKKSEPTGKTQKTSSKDQPLSKPFWEGTFFGVYAGKAWGNTSLNTTVGNVTPSSYYISTADVNSVSQNASGAGRPHGAIGGIQLNSNFQTGRIVYGSVLDYGSFYLTSSKHAARVTYPATPSLQYNLKTFISTTWLASLRARLGYALPGAWPLLYVSGGLAITNIHLYNAFNDGSATGGNTNTKIKPGYILTAGLELPIKKNWTIGGEYEYVHFDSNQVNSFIVCHSGSCSGQSPYSTSGSLKGSAVKIGLNYRL